MRSDGKPQTARPRAGTTLCSRAESHRRSQHRGQVSQSAPLAVTLAQNCSEMFVRWLARVTRHDRRGGRPASRIARCGEVAPGSSSPSDAGRLTDAAVRAVRTKVDLPADSREKVSKVSGRHDPARSPARSLQAVGSRDRAALFAVAHPGRGARAGAARYAQGKNLPSNTPYPVRSGSPTMIAKARPSQLVALARVENRPLGVRAAPPPSNRLRRRARRSLTRSTPAWIGEMRLEIDVDGSLPRVVAAGAAASGRELKPACGSSASTQHDQRRVVLRISSHGPRAPSADPAGLRRPPRRRVERPLPSFRRGAADRR
jgi:hypothetical protein